MPSLTSNSLALAQAQVLQRSTRSSSFRWFFISNGNLFESLAMPGWRFDQEEDGVRFVCVSNQGRAGNS
jgi:hypothetical protein